MERILNRRIRIEQPLPGLQRSQTLCHWTPQVSQRGVFLVLAFRLRDEGLEAPRVKALTPDGPPRAKGQSRERTPLAQSPGVDFTALQQLDPHEGIHLGPKHILWPLIL